ncbi:MAG: FKBP-type peptidyl-prolyl cis-trans isomerase [Candidatus Binatia bacterium]
MFVWQFRKNALPKEVSILDIGHSKFFYGKPGPGTLDARITDDENEHGAFVARLRRERKLSPSDEETLVEFVHHVALRTRNLRDTLEKSFQFMFEEIYSIFTDPEAACQQMLREQEKGSHIWDQVLTSYVRNKYGVRNYWLEIFLKWLENKDCKRWLTHGAETHVRQQTALYKEQLTPLIGQVGEGIKASHNEGLARVFQSSASDSPPRHRYYRQLRWRVQELEEGTLILGDVAVLQFERRSGKFSAAFDGVAGDVIFLPLSHNLLVIGSPEDTGDLPASYEINSSSAKLSLHYFVASRNSEQEKGYQRLLGSATFRAPKIFVPSLTEDGKSGAVKISYRKKVSLEYTLTLEDGSAVDSNVGKKPLVYTQGTHEIIPGLEKQLVGLKAGDTTQIEVSPEEGYGPVDPTREQEIDKTKLPEEARKIGIMLEGRNPEGQKMYARVAEMKAKTVVLDLNHPLAGKKLIFDVKVLKVEERD